MSTGLASAPVADGFTNETIQAQPLEVQKTWYQAKYGQLPATKRYMVNKGRVIQNNGEPVIVDKKKSSGRNKPKKPTYSVPEGKLRTNETPNFDVNVHARLKSIDFADPLDYCKWDVWYYGQKLAQANKEVTRMEAMGKTPDERNAARDSSRLMKALENMLAKTAASGNASLKAALAAQLGDLFAKSEG